MTSAWQLPISQMSQWKPKRMLHYGPVSVYTDAILRAQCGYLFNPGFATKSRNIRHCEKCKKRI